MYLEKKIIESPNFRRNFFDIIENAESASVARNSLQIQHDLDDVNLIDSEWHQHSPLSAAISTILDSSSRIGDSVNLLTQLKRRKRLKPIPDEAIECCTLCKKSFTTFIRRHHCRCCGQIFCNDCSDKRIELDPARIVYRYDYYFTTKYRVCNICYNESLRYNELKSCIQFFENLSMPLPLLYRCATLCRRWRESIIYFLSDIRQIQYKLPTEALTESEKSFLKNNVKYLTNHSVWMLQYYKINDPITAGTPAIPISRRNITPLGTPEASPSNHYIKYGDISSLDLEIEEESVEIIPISCTEMLCGRCCKPRLNVFDALFLLAGNYQPDLSIELLSNNDTIIEMICPFLLYTGSDKLIDFLIQKAKTNKNILRSMYWNLKVSSSDSKYTNILENLLITSADRDIISQNQLVKTFVRYAGQGYDIKTLKQEIRKLPRPLINPINGDVIEKIDLESITVKNSHTKPVFFSYWNAKQEYCSMLYKNEDIRKDAYLVMIINFIRHILELEGVKLPIITYGVMPVTINSGFIEIVDGATTLYTILNDSDLLSYLNTNNQQERVGELMERFRDSLAFWTVLTFIVGLGDRHIDNIMLLKNGTLFHIDYGYIFCKSPHVYDQSKIRLDDDMVRCLGGQTSYTDFKNKCYQIFFVLRKYVMIIYSLMLVLCKCQPKIQDYDFDEEFFKNHINDVMMIGQTDEEVKNGIEKIIDNSRGSISIRLTDYFHGFFSYVKQQIL